MIRSDGRPPPSAAKHTQLADRGAAGARDGAAGFSSRLPDTTARLLEPLLSDRDVEAVAADAPATFHDRAGRPIAAAPLELPPHVEADALRRILAFREPGFLPVHEFTDHNGKTILLQEALPSVALEELLRECSTEREEPWKELFADGRRGLVHAFIRLVRLVAALRAADIDLPVLGAARVHLATNGVLHLRAADLLGSDDRAESERALHYSPPDLMVASRAGHGIPDSGHIYSLAALLFHALTGAPPYPGRSESEIVHRILAGEALGGARWPADLPATLQRYLLDSVSLDPQCRPPSFTAFAGGLEAALAGDPVRSVPHHLLQGTAHSGARRGAFILTIVLAAAAVIYLITGSDQNRRANLLEDLADAAYARPFPAHGEEPPLDEGAAVLLARVAADEYRHDPAVQLLRGWAELRRGRFEDALLAFRTAESHRRDSIPAWVSIGIARLEKGEAAGEGDIAHGLALAAANEEDWIYRGAGQFYLQDFAAAIESFETVTRMNPQSALAWCHLATLHNYEGNVAAGRAALERSVKERPDNLWLTWLEAEFLAAEAENDRAKRLLEERKARLLGSPAVLLRCGSLLTRMGHEQEGREWIECARRGLALPEDEEMEFTRAGRPVVAKRCVMVLGPRAVKESRAQSGE